MATTTYDRGATTPARLIRRIRAFAGYRAASSEPTTSSAWSATTLRENQIRPFERRLLGIERDRARFYGFAA